MVKKRSTKKGPSKKKVKKKKNFEARGLLILSLTLLFFLSVFSFVKDSPNLNWLGFLGYWIAYFSMYLFGFASFLFPIYFSYLGIKYISDKKLDGFVFKTMSFLALLISVSFLLSIYADSFPHLMSAYNKKIFSDQIYQYKPHPHVINRYYLGGPIFYYLYKDLPYFNLKNILSTTGSALIFSSSTMISFLLFTGINVISKTKKSFLKKSKKKKKAISFEKTIYFYSR